MAKIISKIDEFVDKNIIEFELDHLMGDRFGRYSKYIIQDRALPDVRDGLKPVQRRILFGMSQMGLYSNKPYKKSARITGEVMGKYHPHGDSSIYEALVRMSQDFKMRIPLIDMHGNNGSIDGDGPAAMRYTEARLSKAAEYILEDLDKKTVPFVPNFDDEEMEPVLLPSKFPNLLVNGSTGISAGYATNIPPHNINEVIDATIHLLKNPKATYKDLMQFIKGPDFPTGGIVQGISGIKSALEKGAGKVIVRSKVIVEEITKSQLRLVVQEIPYEVKKAELVKKIDTLRFDKILEDIIEVRDESDREGLRIAIDLKKGADYNVTLAYLYKNTDLQVSYNYNMVAIVNNRPEQIGIIKILNNYLDHYREIITNRSNFLLAKAKKREHIVLGLIKMVSILDEVIKIIRKSLNKADSKKNLINKYDFSEEQAEAIVTLQLYRLSNTDIVLLEEEKLKLADEIQKLEKILSSEKALNQVIEKELIRTGKELQSERLTKIEDEIENIKINEKELISHENIMLGVTNEGYIKRSTTRSYSSTKDFGLKENDFYILEKEVSTLDTLLIFTNLGNYIFLPIYKLDDQKWGDLGVYVNNIVPIAKNEKVIDSIVVSNFNTNQLLLLATKQGMMKQVKLKNLLVSRYSKPVKVMKLTKDDYLQSVSINQLPNIVSITKNGYILRFRTLELPEYGLHASGVKSMIIAKDDELVNAIYIDQTEDFLILTNRGHLLSDNASSVPLYNRYRRGVLQIEKLKKNPHLVVDLVRFTRNQVKENREIKVIFDEEIINVHPSDLKSLSKKFGQKIDTERDSFARKIILDKSINDEIEVIENIMDDTKIKKDSTAKNNKKIKIEEKIIEPTHLNNIMDELKENKKEVKKIHSLFDDIDNDY